ncbi:MAG: hypothetical protein IKP40_07820 [Clostridia bacterium]|nr:hypothetical protein [Clostridia bacterium]
MARVRNDFEGRRWQRFRAWLNEGDTSLDSLLMDAVDGRSSAPQPAPSAPESADPGAVNHLPLSAVQARRARAEKFSRGLYRTLAVLICFGLIGVLLATAAALPPFGNPDNPVHNEVSRRYIEQGMAETGAVNVVAGMILDYRAFDTLGESNVLFTAACAVLILLRLGVSDRVRRWERDLDARLYEPQNDAILQTLARFLTPMALLFGFYIVLNGHLSPGGGFSGGAVMGAGLILYLNAFGYEKTARFMNYRVFQTASCAALTFYAAAKSYSFFTGANHLPSFINAGIPGMLFSAGLIPYLNIAVGLVVCCTMYAFYTLFRKGDM